MVEGQPSDMNTLSISVRQRNFTKKRVVFGGRMPESVSSVSTELSWFLRRVRFKAETRHRCHGMSGMARAGAAQHPDTQGCGWDREHPLL